MNQKKQTSALNIKDIEHTLRTFNVAFNSALLYGGDHPTTIKTSEPFIIAILKILEFIPSISLIVDRGSLFLDEYCADKIINTKRIIAQFSKCTIQSITFEKNVGSQDIHELLKIVGDIKTVHPVDQIQATLQKSGCKGIRLNYVHYGKITSEETLISKDVADAFQTDSFSNSAVNPNTITEIDNVLSLAKLIDQPKDIAAILSSTAVNEHNIESTAHALSQIRSDIKNTEPQSIESLLNAVYELKVDLSDAIATQKLTGKILAATEPAQNELDNLTCDVLKKLVVEEYLHGDTSIKRLAQIIRRMLPDLSELKRVLPLLKNSLIAEGMSLSDYLQLIRQIDLEMESESIATILDDAASGIGVSTEDVVNAIKAQPNEAAKLLFLASEIHQGTEQDDMQLSNILTEYIEKASSSIALDSKDISGPGGSKVLEKIISHVQNQLIDKLKGYGIDEPILLSVKKQLGQRFNLIFENTATQWMVNSITPGNENTSSELATKLIAFLGQDDIFSRLKDPLIQALSSKGYDNERIENFIKQISNHIVPGNKSNLPPNVLSSNNMLFLLNRELKQHFRYSTAFSTLLISVGTIQFSDGSIRKPETDDLPELISQLFVTIKKMIRDIDLIGSLGGKDEFVFTILTMTNENGAIVVQKRILKHIKLFTYLLKNQKVKVFPIISITSPVKDVTKDLNSYIETVRNNHNQEITTIDSKRE